MPSKNMLPKGKRRQSVKKDYRAARSVAQDQAAAERARIAENFGQEPEQTATQLIATADFMEAEPTLEERIATNNWFTTKGASGSKVAEETHDPRRYENPYARIHEPPKPEIAPNPALAAPAEDGVRTFTAEPAAANMRLDAYLARAVPDVSRSRVQMLIDGGQVTIDGAKAKASHKLRGGETIRIEGEAQPAPIRATPEDIPLTVVYEDADLAVIDKPAGMMVHAGSGSSTHNTGTLVNALLHRFGTNLSTGAAPIADDDNDIEASDDESDSSRISDLVSRISPQPRPGIVHRLDKDTSGLIVVAKNDLTHRKLGELFAGRKLRKTYIALVHGFIADDTGTISLAIARDVQRRIRMTTRRPGGRHAVSHWRVLERLETPWGKFTLVEVRIETGRTHQIRVHMQAIGHSVVGDNLYGAPKVIRPPVTKNSPAAKPRKRRPTNKPKAGEPVQTETLSLDRNFLHGAELEFAHPRTGKTLSLRAELPAELQAFLERLKLGADAGKAE